MSTKLVSVKNKLESKNKIPNITYYFTAFFTVIGTLTVMYLLNLQVGKISLFIILLSITAGGLPFGFIGAFLDYKTSEYKIKKNKSIIVNNNRESTKH